jgi:hypothetical protein
VTVTKIRVDIIGLLPDTHPLECRSFKKSTEGDVVFFANLRFRWIDSSQWRNILGSKRHAVSSTPFASMSGAAPENSKPTKPLLHRWKQQRLWFDLRRKLCRIAEST